MLLAVEEMILLSDLEFKDRNVSTNHKIIGIKPIKRMDSTEPGENVEKEKVEDAAVLINNAKNQLLKAKEEADYMLESARLTIQKEKKEWEEEKRTLIIQAEESGLQRGIEQGRLLGYQEYEDLIKQAVDIVKQAKKDYQATLTESEDVIIHIALTAASKILKTEVIETDHYVKMVQQVLKEVKDQAKIAVYAHPDDYHLLLTQKDELLNIVHFDADLTIYPDGELKRGGCIIESPYGMINAGVDSQLQELRDKLFEISKEKAIESE